MDKTELLEALKDLDSHLPSPCDVVVVGGAAMILQFGAARATRDVDALFLRGDRESLRSAIRAVARDRHLPDGWINDAVKGFGDILPPDFYHRLTALDLPFNHLHLYALGLPEQIAMKVVALRDQDLEDLQLLLPRASEADRRAVTAIVTHVAEKRPDWAQRMRYFLMEQGWTTD
jgi:hypothetical protein